MPDIEAQHPPPSGADDADAPRPAGRRPGMPSDDTVVSEETLTSPKGRRYRVLRTRQTDPYDEAPEEQATTATGG